MTPFGTLPPPICKKTRIFHAVVFELAFFKDSLDCDFLNAVFSVTKMAEEDGLAVWRSLVGDSDSNEDLLRDFPWRKMQKEKNQMLIWI